jgi:hypothetical protein
VDRDDLRLRTLASVVLLAAGCYEAHQLEGTDGADAARPDAGIDAGRPDAGLPDAGLPDAVLPDAALPPCPGAYVPARATRLCALTPTGTIPAGEPTAIPVAIGGCFCQEIFACRGEVIAPRVLELSTLICPDEDGCKECGSFLETRCEVPPLAAGEWEIRIEGTPAAQVVVAPRMTADPARPICWNVAPPDDRCSWPPATAPVAGVRVCHRDLADVGSQPAFTLDLPCPDCSFGPGGCEVQLERNALHVRPLARGCPVDECEPGCRPVQAFCHPPPLAAGDYEVRFEGSMTRSLLRVRDIVPGEPTTELCVAL